MWNHGLAAECGVEATRDTTKHCQPEVQLNVVVQRLVTLQVVLTEGAETGVYPDQISTPTDSDGLCSGNLAHRHLRYQVMQSEVLVIPEFVVSPVHNLPTTFLYDLDEVHWFYYRVASRKHSGWGIAV